MTTWARNQTDPNLRQATLNVADIDDGSFAPSGTSLAGLLFIRLGGTSFIAASGTLVNTGFDGSWLYTATQAETNIDTNEIELRIVDATWFAQTLVQINASGDSLTRRRARPFAATTRRGTYVPLRRTSQIIERPLVRPGIGHLRAKSRVDAARLMREMEIRVGH